MKQKIHTAQRPGRAMLQWQRAQRVERNRQLETLRLRLAGLPTEHQHSPRRAP